MLTVTNMSTHIFIYFTSMHDNISILQGDWTHIPCERTRGESQYLIAKMAANRMRTRNKKDDEIILFDSLNDANEFIKKHEIKMNTRYTTGYVNKQFGRTDVDRSPRVKVHWSHGLHPYMYIVLGHKVLKCHHGPDKNKKKKLEKDQMEILNSLMGSYDNRKTRHSSQPTKKLDCPAVIILKDILLFTTEKDTTNKIAQQMAASEIRKDLSKGKRKIMMVLPMIPHENHPVGENAGLCQRIDASVANKVKELVWKEGVSNVKEMSRHISTYVKNEIAPPPSKTNRRFVPSEKVLRYHMDKATKATKPTTNVTNHQENVFDLTHPSVRMKGTEANYQPEQCFDPSCSDKAPHMHCPFCVKCEYYTDPVILKAHYRVKHVDKGIDFAGLKILRCCDQCEIVGVIKGEKRFKGAHWHCYKCRNGFNRRDEAIKHYKTHFRNPHTTFQIQIAQDTNQPVTQGFETEEAAASIPVDSFTVHSVNSSLPAVTTYAQAHGSEMLHRGVDEMVTGVGAIETVGLSDTQTIMIIQDETGSLHNTSQDLSNTSSLVSDSGGDSRLEMQVKELQHRVAQLEQELGDREATIRDLQAKLSASKAREQELLQQLSIPSSKNVQDLCQNLENQHSELLKAQLKLVQQAVLRNHNQNKTSHPKMIIINPVGTSLNASSLLNSSQDVIDSVLNSGLTIHGSQALSVSLPTCLSATDSIAVVHNQDPDADCAAGDMQQVKAADFISKDLLEQDFSESAEHTAESDTDGRPPRKKAKTHSQSEVELQNL